MKICHRDQERKMKEVVRYASHVLRTSCLPQEGGWHYAPPRRYLVRVRAREHPASVIAAGWSLLSKVSSSGTNPRCATERC